MKFKLVSNEHRKIALNMDAINLYVARYKPFTPFDFECVRRQKKVSTPMRKYYFGVVMTEFCKGFGYEPDEMLLVHRHLKIRFFKVEPDKHGIYRDKDIPSVFGNESEIPISEKNDFIEYVKRQAAINGVYIPDPNE